MDILHELQKLGPGMRGEYREADRARQFLSSRKDYILIASTLKSASTFLWTVLQKLTGFVPGSLIYAFHQNEQQLYLRPLVEALSFESISRHHTKATGPNLELLKLFSIRPIILVRDIFDTVISLYDHTHKDSLPMPVLHLNDRYFDLDEATQLEMLVDLAVPWFIHFYVSWVDAEQRGEVEVLWVTFEEMVTDPHTTLRRALEFHGIERTDEAIDAALAQTSKSKTRYNKGVSGRGKARLSSAQQERILRMTSYYPWVDFSRVGIPPA